MAKKQHFAGMLALAIVASSAQAGEPMDCGQWLSGLHAPALQGATGLSAETVPPPASRSGVAVAVDRSQSACRIKGTLHARPGSAVGFEAWLPLPWNGRLLMLGNGGYSSEMPYRQMAQAAARGYAVAATDTGHTGDDPVFARDAPEAIDDWGHRAVHETAQAALALVSARYGKAPQHRYFVGCSTGGHQAFMEAQRYPDDFDGIVAGAPGYNRVRLNTGFLWQYVQNHSGPEPAKALLAPQQLALLARTSVAACRGDNGAHAGGLASDGFLDNPMLCHFDPAVLACSATRTSACLLPAQVEAARRMYDGARDPVSGERLYPGWPPGSEASDDLRSGWHVYWADPRDPALPARSAFWRYWAGFTDDRDWTSFDFHADFQRAQQLLSTRIDATSPDLGAFASHGGKLIHYHGEADPVVPFADSIAYHDAVHRRSRFGAMENVRGPAAPVDDYYRLFLAPGMGHCLGGPGYMPEDPLGALERWVEEGQAPDQLAGVAATAGNAATLPPRPLCPYPKVARNVAASGQAPRFTCRLP
jgi:feruloyl esterase